MADTRDQIDFIVADLEGFTAKGMTALAINMVANLVEATPVDLGWARAGWVPSFGKPYSGGAQRKIEPSMVGPAQARQSLGQSEVLGYRLSDGPIFITNNVIYILPLADGSSPQASAGWVPDAIERALRDANR